MKKVIPNLRGIELEEAKKILDEQGIKYEDEVEKSFSFLGKDKIVKTSPKAQEEAEDKVKLYVSRGPLIPIIILVGLVLTGLSLTLGQGVYRSIVNHELITGMKAPKIRIKETEIKKDKLSCFKDTVIQIENTSNKKMAYYEYCIKDEKGTKGCEWKSTTTNNIVVAENGHKYVNVRGIDEDGNRTQVAEIEIWIDNENPVIKNFKVTKTTRNSISVETKAEDKGCGLNKYSYSLDGRTWEEGSKEYTFNNLREGTRYRVYVKVEDTVGNSIVVSMEVSTTAQGGTVTPIDPTNPDNPVVPVPTDRPEPTASPEPTSSPEPTPTPTSGPEVDWDIPQISLEGVPTVITYGDKYDLPTSVDFGNDTGTYSCVVRGIEYKDTSTLKIGKNLIVCTATSSHNKQAMVEKEVEVKMTTGEDEILEGWMRYNIYYPDDSYNRQWRLVRDNEVRTEEDGWEDYTGPILIKVEDIENIYIRYDLEGETYIIAPRGKVTVDIDPKDWNVKEDSTTTVKINYDKNATVKQYRINGGSWIDYTEPFEVEAETLIDARVEKEEKVYNNLGEYQYTKKYSNNDTAYVGLYVEKQVGPRPTSTPVGPTPTPESGGGTPTPKPVRTPKPVPTYPEDLSLEGPIITGTPTSIVIGTVRITITTEEEAEAIYYSVGGGSYQKYTDSFEVTENTWIRAYYIRKTDGKVSSTSRYRVNNIRQGRGPYVGITATPDNYLSKDVEKVLVTVIAQDYDEGTLEYSFDNVIYQAYTEPFEVSESTTVYARARNQYDDGNASLEIKTTTPPKHIDKLDVHISASPSKKDVVGLVNKTTVTINYDGRAEKKYYSLDGYNYQEYTGPFEVTSNTTVFAYATSATGKGSSRLLIDYLTTGIAKPIIGVNTRNKAYQVKVDIEYDQNASIKRYKIGNGEWQDYFGEFYVYENTTVYAYNENELGYNDTSSRVIGNIVPEPEIITLDEGMYYLIRINYPIDSSEESREYKWLESGTWKQYDEKGILLIKPEYIDQITQTVDGIKVKDSKGRDVVITDHYYFLEKPLYEAMDDIFIRWDNKKPAKPEINLDTDGPAQEVEVNITYSNRLVKKYYKVVTAAGEDTGWLTYTGPIKVKENGTVIYAKGINGSEIETEVASKEITNIDDEAPVIVIKGDLTTPKQKVRLTPVVTDNMMTNMVKYAKGSHDIEYFRNIDDTIRNQGPVTIEENGIYTFYAIDQAGNETVKEVEVTNIDKDAPNIDINLLTNRLSSIVEVEIDYADATTKQYKIGTGNWQNYTDKIILKSYEHAALAEDGVITIYAKGKDQAGNESDEVFEKIYNLDTDLINAPIIHATASYPTITEYGIRYGDVLSVVYDNRDDITNYICTSACDEASNWHVYTGSERVVSGTVKARSIKNSSGMSIETSKNVEQPSDAIGPNAYDGDQSSSFAVVNNGSNKIYISNTVWGREINVLGQVSTEYNSWYRWSYSFYDESDNQLSTGEYRYTEKEDNITIPEGSKYLVIGSVWGNFNIKELTLLTNPLFNATKYYPIIDVTGIIVGYNNVSIEYFRTSAQKLYKIKHVDGTETDWMNYTKPMRLEIGEVVYAKGVDINGNDLLEDSYTAVLDDDAVGLNAYDHNADTSFPVVNNATNKMLVNSNAWDRKINVTAAINTGGYNSWYYWFYAFYDQNDQELERKTYNYTYTNVDIEIPKNTKYVLFGSVWGTCAIKEIKLLSMPTFGEVDVIYPTITEYGVVSSSDVSINYHPSSVQKLYKIKHIDNTETEWLTYTNGASVKAGETIYAKGIDKNGYDSEIAELTLGKPSDAIGPKAIDEDPETYESLGRLATYYIGVDSSMWGKKIYVKISRNVYFTPLDSDGNDIIEQQLGPNDGAGLTIPEGTVKLRIKNPTEGGYTYEIGPFNEPVITGVKHYPTITEYGVESDYNTVTIEYFNTSVKREYKIDDGDWQNYTGEVRAEIGETLYARGTDKNGKYTKVTSYTAEAFADTIKPKAYDGDIATSESLGRLATYYIGVDSSMWGEKIYVNIYRNVYFTPLDSNDNELSEQQIGPTDGPVELIIPEGTVKLRIKNPTEGGYTYEIGPFNEPVITGVKHYPTITEYGVESDYNTATIKYFKTSVQRLYQIKKVDGTITDWANYTGEIKLEIGETLYARGTDKNGKYTKVTSYTAEAFADTIKPKAYDGDIATSESLGRLATYYIGVDSSMWGEKIYVNIYRNVYFTPLDSNDNELSEQQIGPTDGPVELIIPEGTVKLRIKNPTEGGYTYEIGPFTDPVITGVKYYPKLTEYGMINSYNTATIKYFKTSVQRLYQIKKVDGTITDWTNYTGEIKLEIGEVLYAKGVDKYGTETPTVEYTAADYTDILKTPAYDGDESTSHFVGRTATVYVNVDPSMWGKDLYVKADRGGVYYTPLDDSGTATGEQAYGISDGKLFTVPEGTTRLSIYVYAGSANTNIYEFRPYYQPVITAVKYYPKLTEYGMNHSYNTVTVSYYATSLQKQYKINDGTWQNYTGEVRLEIGETIYTRGIDKYGTKTPVTEYTATDYPDILQPPAYDGDESTAHFVGRTETVYVDVDSSMWGKDLYVKADRGGVRYTPLDSNGTATAETVYGITDGKVFTVPEGTTRLSIYVYAGSASTYIYELRPLNPTPRRSAPKLSGRAKAYIAPQITIDTLDLVETKIISIAFQEGLKGEYSLDFGKTWLEYKEPITITENTTVLARTVDNEGKVIRISSFTITTVKPKEDEVTSPTDTKEKDETDDKTGGEVIKPEGSEENE